MKVSFELHPQLAADTVRLGDWPLCRVLLMNESRYPWFILVPRRPELREIFELSGADRAQFLAESCALAEWMQTTFRPDKLNIAALGNVVPQLHIHHIARFSDDAAWPAPVWGKFPATAYAEDLLRAQQAVWRAQLSDRFPLS